MGQFLHLKRLPSMLLCSHLITYFFRNSKMASLINSFKHVFISLLFLCAHDMLQVMAQWPKGGSTRFYDFKVQMLKVTKLCHTRNIVTINQMYPGPVVYAQEDDRLIIKLTNETPYNASIHWHGVRQILSCWSDGPSYITQCPVQSGQTFTYEFTLIKQKGTLFWHAHFSWLRATVYGALIIYPKKGVPYPFKYPYEEHTIILGEYWNKDLVQLERNVLASGGPAPVAEAYTINGHPGPNYNCSENGIRLYIKMENFIACLGLFIKIGVIIGSAFGLFSLFGTEPIFGKSNLTEPNSLTYRRNRI
ncbi:putative laccase [Helianthus annuus]|uniref:Laccase n=1 Tax=Helianthus annuus TaxID=4232 RepID=A0A9K3DKK0_HELAN|nr:putative laccase [Helianthus annuus]KAJ0448875.1 putative laccase [Helianthus annuus]